MSTYLGELEDQFPDELIIGVDEAGVGTLAGPVTAAAVILDLLLPTTGFNDSKKLTAGRRIPLAKRIREEALFFGTCMLGNEVVDSIGIKRASDLAKRRSVQQVLDQLGNKNVQMAPLVLVDGDQPIRELGRVHQRAYPKGDGRSWSIAAASILAKELHDDWMRDVAQAHYPDYFFSTHMGYGTQLHHERLLLLGPCPIHRRSVHPVKDLLLLSPAKPLCLPGAGRSVRLVRRKNEENE